MTPCACCAKPADMRAGRLTSEGWQESDYCLRCMAAASERTAGAIASLKLPSWSFGPVGFAVCEVMP